MATQFISATPASPAAPLRLSLPAEKSGMMETIGFLCFALYFFLIFSRMPEIFALRFGHSFYQIFITSLLCLVFVVVGGGLSRVVGSKLSLWLIGLHIWYCLSFPFSYWRSGTLDQLSYVARYFPMTYFAMGLARTEKHLRGVFVAMRAAMLVTLIFTLTAKTVVVEGGDDRLQMDGGRFGNSNEIAMYLLIGLPFWLHMAVSTRFPMVLRVLAGLEIGLSIFQCLRTGSRGGLITILLLGVLLLVMSSAINRLKIIALTLAVILIAVPLLPSAVRARLNSVTGDSHDDGAAGSSQSRLALLLESITLTALHPIFGVGLGVYPTAAAQISEKQGKRKLWQVSHNAYTQVSAEAGLPALFMFLGTLGITIASLRRSKRMSQQFPQMQELGMMCDCMLLTTLVYIVSGLFANIALELFYYMICGVSFLAVWVVQDRFTALTRARDQQLQQTTVSGDSAAPPPESPGFRLRDNTGFTMAQAPVTTPEPTIGRPKPVPAESLYGDVPWARNPNRSR
jgi:O-antigen ligase